jgi:hypothetical protein
VRRRGRGGWDGWNLKGEGECDGRRESKKVRVGGKVSGREGKEIGREE